MTPTVFVVAVIVVVGALVVALSLALAATWRSRGERLVTCPETGAEVGVRIDGLNAAAHLGHGTPELRSCSRWPERRDCGQECVAQIERAADGCRVRSELARWYDGKACALCGKAFELDAFEHDPAVMSPDGVTRPWSEIHGPEVHRLLATGAPVCWDCHIVQTLYRKHPELVVERPWRWSQGDSPHERVH